MPARSVDSEKPEGFIPTLDVILAIVRARPGITLRTLAGLLWSSLPWSPAMPGADSALMRLRAWPGLTARVSAATWRADRCGDLVLAGVARYGARDRREVDPVAAITLYAVADLGAVRCGHA